MLTSVAQRRNGRLRRARTRASFASGPAIPFAPRIASPTLPRTDAQPVFDRLPEAPARRPGPSGFETVAARVWRDEAGTFAEKVTTRRRGQQHGRGESGRLADDHARRPHRRDRGHRPVHRRRRLPLHLADRRLGRAGARRAAHPLPRHRRRRARRGRQEADPPDEDRGPRERVQVHRPLGRHRRDEPRRSRKRASASATPA